MSQALIFRVFLTWLLFVPIAFLNGTLRQLWYQKLVGEMIARQISVATASAAFLVFSYFMFRGYAAGLDNVRLLIIGSLWTLLTVAFECALGLVTHKSWQEIFADYNLLKGRLWPVVLLVIFLSPFLIKWFSQKS